MMPRLTGVVKHLVLMNIIAYIAAQIFFDGGQMFFAATPNSASFRPYQVVSYMFMHGDIGHLFFNMLILFFLGPMVETALNAKRFLTLYLICGLGSFVLHMVMWFVQTSGAAGQVSYLLGASGAVYGVVIAFAILFPDMKLNLIIPPVAIKAKYLALGYVALDLFQGLSSAQTGVAHFAHIGGALTGVLLMVVWGHVRKRR